MRFYRLFTPSLIIVLLLAILPAQADQGMWPIQDLDKIDFDTLYAKGLQLKPEQIYNPKGGGLSDAVVRMGGTGAFVSSEGLMLTNHHVAFGAIQRASTMEHNYIRDGFYAEGKDKEIPAIGYNCYVTLDIKDVTDRILTAVNDKMSDLDRHYAIENATKKIIKEAEKGRDVRCRVASFFGGKRYALYTELKIRDLRIVYAPPAAIGNYGDEIDNWMWPRHVGDFSFLRAYVGPDGKTAEYSKDNVPFRPKVTIPISSGGVKEGDFTILLGFPGGTSRYASSAQIKELFTFYYPTYVKSAGERLKLLEEAAKLDSNVAIRVASRISGISNFYKKSLGLIEGYRRSDILDNKLAIEKDLSNFVAADPTRSIKYGSLLVQFDSLYAGRKATREKDFVLDNMFGNDFLSTAKSLYRWFLERAKKDIEREQGYQDRDTAATRESLEDMQINLLPSVDKMLFRHSLKRALQLPEGQKINGIEQIFASVPKSERLQYLDKYLDSIFAVTTLGTVDRRLGMFRMTTAELEATNDPFMKLAIALYPESQAQEKRDKAFNGARKRLDPLLAAAYAEWKQDKLYPDANSTMRVNFGEVKGYAPRDATAYHFYTTLTGVMEKETGEDPFIVPQALKEVYLRKDYGKYLDPMLGDVPVDFIDTNSGTNGNSGSPILNGKGELIGLDFDTNYEGVSADYWYDPDLSRSIAVDTRYILFILDKVYHLDNLLKELTIH